MSKSYFVQTPDQRPDALNVVGTKVSVLASSSETGCYGMTFQEGEEGTGPPPHSHDWDEAFYVISGEVYFQCAGDKHRCPAGTLVHIPRNTEHGFSYAKGGGTMVEVTSRDGTAAELFTAIDSHISADTDPATIVTVAKENGVTIAG